MRPCMAARRRSRSAAEARGMSAADFRTTLRTTDFFCIPLPLRRCRHTRAHDSRDLGVVRRSVRPGNDQDNSAIVRVRCGGHIPLLLVRAVLAVEFLDVERVAQLVSEDE